MISYLTYKISYYTPPQYIWGIMVSCWTSLCLSVLPSAYPSICHPSVRISFPDNNLSKHQWIFTKLGMWIDIVEIWFGIAIGQTSPIFDSVICLPHVHVFIFQMITSVNVSRFSPNLVCSLILWDFVWDCNWANYVNFWQSCLPTTR